MSRAADIRPSPEPLGSPCLEPILLLLRQLMALLFDPEAALAEIEALLREAEARAARVMLEHAIASTGCDLNPDDYDCRVVWRGRHPDFEFTPKWISRRLDPRRLRIRPSRRPRLPNRYRTDALAIRRIETWRHRRRAGAFRSARKPTPARTARRFAIPP